ncbi:Trk family potassium uptake protein [Candidatus Aerophobetes bacterium]|nr:Trk family potassium uptake protein [Candidatus Aerophobetes bacterium]
MLASLRLSPPLTVVSAFLIIITIGTLLLVLPHSTVPGKDTSFIDALFTAASATCVTGLIVVDTGSHFSIFGQLVILVLVQIGGLGLMVFASLFALTWGDFGVRERLILRDIVRYENLSKIRYLVLFILAFTLIFEATGAILLYFQFLPLEKSSLQAAYSALFHSVSAFCNAGFSIYSDSFRGYQNNLPVNLIMTFLIIWGGLGFIVILNIMQTVFARMKGIKKSLSLHSKLVIITTLTLIGLGTLFLYTGEGKNLLKDLSLQGKILASFFQSVTARTAGFNTIHIGSLTTFTSFFLIILMFIGASPGSTGGGIKTSTFATLLLTIKSMIQGKDEVETLKRTIPRTIVYQTLCVAILAFGWISVATLFLSFTESSDFLTILFEVFSAFGTVGLSRGITANLTSWGKMIIIITVLVGRIGPLTLALAIAGKKVAKRYRYPEESIIIG